MARFITEQQHASSCGPVAIINALKWLGYSVSYREELPTFTKLGYDDGTNCYDLRRMLNAYQIKYKLYKQSSIKKLEQILNRGNTAIVCYDWVGPEDRGGHYIFIDSDLKHSFGAYNYQIGIETGALRKDTLDAYFYTTKKRFRNAKTSSKWKPAVWEIIK